jgi:hypothetical protein
MYSVFFDFLQPVPSKWLPDRCFQACSISHKLPRSTMPRNFDYAKLCTLARESYFSKNPPQGIFASVNNTVPLVKQFLNQISIDWPDSLDTESLSYYLMPRVQNRWEHWTSALHHEAISCQHFWTGSSVGWISSVVKILGFSLGPLFFFSANPSSQYWRMLYTVHFGTPSCRKWQTVEALPESILRW